MLSLFMTCENKHGGESILHKSMRSTDMIQQEVKGTLSYGRYLKQPLILLDPYMTIPWDMLNSFIYGLKDYINTYPAQSK